MTSRRAFVAGGGGAALLAGLGYRAWDRGVFSAGEGAPFALWNEWDWHPGTSLQHPLHAAVLASNAHDSQPWLFEYLKKENAIEVYANPKRSLGRADPFNREMYMSLGCAIENWRLAAVSQGIGYRIEPVPGHLEPSLGKDPIPAARIYLLPPAFGWFNDSFSLIEAIHLRHTNRGVYDLSRLPPRNLLGSLRFFADWFGAMLNFVVRVPEPGVPSDVMTAQNPHGEMCRMILDATKQYVEDPLMAEASAPWLRTDRRRILAHPDGMTTDTAGFSPFMTATAKLLPDPDRDCQNQYWLDMTRDIQLASAPVFGVISVHNRRDKAQAISAGMFWQYVHLRIAAAGLAAQPMNQAIEIGDRNRVQDRTDWDRYAARLMQLPGQGAPDGSTNWDPIFIFRMGYALRPAALSPRLSLKDVILPSGRA